MKLTIITQVITLKNDGTRSVVTDFKNVKQAVNYVDNQIKLNSTVECSLTIKILKG